MLTVLSDSVTISGMSEPRWTLRELTAQVEAALQVDYVPAASARVRARPDARTIRYYTTLGLVDRPAGFRGRTALYSRRHLLQLVAIKRLQAEGLSLSEVQARLAGLDDAGLDAAASLPAGASSAKTVTSEGRSRRESEFWAAAPAADAARGRADAPPVLRPAAPAPAQPAPLVGVPLPGGAVVLIPAPRPLTADDLRAVAAAAGPLLETLTRRGLVASL